MMLTPTTRASLLFRLRDPQDHQAWMEFVALYEPLTYRIVRRSGLQDADAREIVQELFIVVSRNINRWNPDKDRGSFRGWLRRVAKNLVINWLRHRERRLLPSGGSEYHAMLNQVAADIPETATFEYEYRRALFHHASERVRVEVQPNTWRAFWETAILRMTAAATAKKLGMSVGMVRCAKCRVMARIKLVVKELEDAE